MLWMATKSGQPVLHGLGLTSTLAENPLLYIQALHLELLHQIPIAKIEKMNELLYQSNLNITSLETKDLRQIEKFITANQQKLKAAMLDDISKMSLELSIHDALRFTAGTALSASLLPLSSPSSSICQTISSAATSSTSQAITGSPLSQSFDRPTPIPIKPHGTSPHVTLKSPVNPSSTAETKKIKTQLSQFRSC